QRALRRQPDALWPNFYQGKCAYQQKHYVDALACFNLCVGLKPNLAWCYANRGLSYAALGRPDDALLDFNKALKLDATLAVALLNRGLLHFRAGRYPLSLAGFPQALPPGRQPPE